MDNFETFKASRSKMDPSARKMTEYQWEQAYSAYRNARSRVSATTTNSEQGSKSKNYRPVKRGNSTRRVQRRPVGVVESGQLRRIVREQSAYSELRLIVDILAWGVLVVVVLTGVMTLLYNTSVLMTLTALLGVILQVIVILVVRLLMQVFIDIPDIALYQSLQKSAGRPKTILDPED